jgi:hypothetical protein
VRLSAFSRAEFSTGGTDLTSETGLKTVIPSEERVRNLLAHGRCLADELDLPSANLPQGFLGEVRALASGGGAARGPPIRRTLPSLARFPASQGLRRGSAVCCPGCLLPIAIGWICTGGPRRPASRSCPFEKNAMPSPRRQHPVCQGSLASCGSHPVRLRPSHGQPPRSSNLSQGFWGRCEPWRAEGALPGPATPTVDGSLKTFRNDGTERSRDLARGPLVSRGGRGAGASARAGWPSVRGRASGPRS